MTLNKQAGNMYPFVDYTWNPIRGKCPHECSYCYMKKFKVGELRLDRKALKDNLGKGNFIFVGSSTDMFAKEVYNPDITEVLMRCLKFPENTYLFQTKNPERFSCYPSYFEKMNVILGTTLESNYLTGSKIALKPYERVAEMMCLKGRKMVSIEPIMDFDLLDFVLLIKKIKPEFVSIGADSQGHNLPEPSIEKVDMLIKELKKFTEVRIKYNLNRLKL